MASNEERIRSTGVGRVRRRVPRDSKIHETMPFDCVSADVSNEHVEYRVPRKGHPPGHDILWEVRTFSRREIADVGPEVWTHGDGLFGEDHEVVRASWGTMVFCVCCIDGELAEYCGANTRVVADNTVVNPFNGLAVFRWEVFVEYIELLALIDVLWRAQRVYCHEYRIAESVGKNGALRFGGTRDEGIYITLGQADARLAMYMSYEGETCDAANAVVVADMAIRPASQWTQGQCIVTEQAAHKLRDLDHGNIHLQLAVFGKSEARVCIIHVHGLMWATH